MSAYDDYLKLKERVANSNSKIIEMILKSKHTPQNILVLKTISNKLEDDKCKTVGAGDTFGFSEGLVNRLMWAAYLVGSSDIEEKSYNRGYGAAIEKIKDTIEDFYES